MRPERPLAAAAVGTLAVALLAALVVPGAVAGPDDRRLRSPGPVNVADVDIAADDVSGATVALRVETRLAHRGNPAENVTVVVRAVDADSGLLQATRRASVGTLRGDRETTVNTTLRVAREGDYRIETAVYRDGERVDGGETTLRNLEALTPAYARSPVAFAERETLPALSYGVADADAGGDRVRLNVSAALTNGGDDASGDLRLTVVARQADSNVVADRASVRVGSVRPGRTVSPAVALTVPDGYNYYLDAVLRKDGVVVDTARSAANLDPTRTVSTDETEESVEFAVSDFESDRGRNEAPTDETGASVQTPGFGPVAALVALLVAALGVRRWSA
jgi:PGF-CTERM protein